MARGFLGMPKLQQKLRRLSGGMRGKVLQAAAVEGGEEIRDVAAGLAPRGVTGKLADNMVAEARRSSPSVGVAGVGPHKDQWYGTFVELGTRYAAARPFLRPALKRGRRAAESRIGAALWRAMRRLAR